MAQYRVKALRQMIKDACARVVISDLAEALRQESFPLHNGESGSQYLAHLAKEVDAVAEQALAQAVEPK